MTERLWFPTMCKSINVDIFWVISVDYRCFILSLCNIRHLNNYVVSHFETILLLLLYYRYGSYNLYYQQFSWSTSIEFACLTNYSIWIRNVFKMYLVLKYLSIYARNILYKCSVYYKYWVHIFYAILNKHGVPVTPRVPQTRWYVGM